ncbi:hypothetical protein [Candidatus Binatus sp.]|uniref:hypothetical protein n=1 Tax=Candidatus Binatus sp. TaxID=2811406 RepID=UPI002F933575
MESIGDKWRKWIDAKSMLQQLALVVAFLAVGWWAWSLLDSVLPDWLQGLLGLAFLLYLVGGWMQKRRARRDAQVAPIK